MTKMERESKRQSERESKREREREVDFSMSEKEGNVRWKNSNCGKCENKKKMIKKLSCRVQLLPQKEHFPDESYLTSI